MKAPKKMSMRAYESSMMDKKEDKRKPMKEGTKREIARDKKMAKGKR